MFGEVAIISTLPALFAFLSPAHQRVVTRLGQVFAEAGGELYLVGGPVRDLLRETTPTDLDFTTDRSTDRNGRTRQGGGSHRGLSDR